MTDQVTTSLTPPLGQGGDPLAAAAAVDAGQAIAAAPEPEPEPVVAPLPEADFQAQQIASDITRDQAVLENLNAELDAAEAAADQSELDRISAATALDKAVLAEKQASRTRDALVAEHRRTTQRITRRRIMLAEAQAAQMERLS